MEWFENLLAFLAVIIELVLGALIFFAIILVAHFLDVAIASLGDPSGSMIYWVSKCGTAFLLFADCVIGLFFVTRGIRNAWRATWGS